MKQQKIKDLLGKNKKLLSTKRNFLLGKPSGQEGSSIVSVMISLLVIAILLFATYSYFSSDKTDDTTITTSDTSVIKEWEKSNNPSELLTQKKYLFEDLSDEHTEALLIIEKKLTSTLINQAWEDSNHEERGNLCFNLKTWFRNTYDQQNMQTKCKQYEDDDDQDEEYEQDTTEVTTDAYQEETTEEADPLSCKDSKCPGKLICDEEDYCRECLVNDDCSKYDTCIKEQCTEQANIWEACGETGPKTRESRPDNDDCKEPYVCRKMTLPSASYTGYHEEYICWHPESEWSDSVNIFSCLTDSDCLKITQEEEKPYICSENKCLDVSEFSEELTEFCDADNPCEEGICKEDEHRCVDCLDNSYCSRSDESCINNECREKSGIKEPCDVDDRADCQENLFCAPIRGSLGPDFANTVCWYTKGLIDMDFCRYSSDCFNMEQETGEDYICVGFFGIKRCVKASEQPQNVEYCDNINPCEDSENFFCSRQEGFCKEISEINQPCSKKDAMFGVQCIGESKCILGTCRFKLDEGQTCQQDEECEDQCAPVEKLAGGYNLQGRRECVPKYQEEGKPCDPSFDKYRACVNFYADSPLRCDKELAMCVPKKQEPVQIAQKR
ncbi:hypothetical protein ACFL0W_00940 [Nanoarchaeota archaeon]